MCEENFCPYAVHYPMGVITALDVLVRIPVPAEHYDRNVTNYEIDEPHRIGIREKGEWHAVSALVLAIARPHTDAKRRNWNGVSGHHNGLLPRTLLAPTAFTDSLRMPL